MFALKNESGTIKFDRKNYVLTSVDYGSIGATHSIAKGIQQIGSRMVNATLDDRPVSIVGFIRATSKEDMEAKKAALYQMCDPRKPFNILPDENMALECYATSTVKFAARKLLNNDRVASFVIDAVSYDPLFKDAVLRYKRIAEWTSYFEWPLVIPVEGFMFSNRSDEMIATLVNNGDTETGLLIHFEASATVENPKLTNIDTGEFIHFERTFEAGETVVINTNYDQETVTSYIGDSITDITNDISLDSTFLKVPVGNTKFHLTADTNATSMTVILYYYQRYLGV